MPTIKDIAEAAKVAPSTVSRVLNNRGWVSDEKVRQVLQAIKELNFKPNSMARSLRTGIKGLLGVLIANPYGTLYDDAFFNRIIRGFGHMAEENGFSLVLTSIHEPKIPAMILNGLVDGVVIGGHIVDEKLIDSLIGLDLKMVILGKHALGRNVSRVITDNTTGMYEGTKYLLAKGHQEIGIITGPQLLYSTLDRIEGYRRALLEAGIVFHEKYIMTQPTNYIENPQHGYFSTKQLLSLPAPPSAIIASDSRSLFGAYQACMEYRMQCERQVEFLGWGEIESPEYLKLDFATIKFDEYDIGKRLAKILIDLVLKSTEMTVETMVPVIKPSS